jgi:pimeloyl-ACP methyl ester carboxylesterase
VLARSRKCGWCRHSSPVQDDGRCPAAARCARRLAPRAHLYGDSYGTFFSQVFAGRHPELLRTLVLDAAYPTFGEDAWYDTQAPRFAPDAAGRCTPSSWHPDPDPDSGSATPHRG